MKKQLLIIAVFLTIIVLTVLVAGVIRFNFTNGGDMLPVKSTLDVRNMSYVVNGDTFALKEGLAENEYTPGSATKNKLGIFGEPVYGDLDADGDTDAAVLLQNDPGGSGTFYYAVLVLNSGGSTYRSTNAMLLGDRIAPQTVEIHDGRAVFNFAVRKGTDPMSAQPSIGKSVWVYYDKKTGEIGEWAKGFEGESNIPR